MTAAPGWLETLLRELVASAPQHVLLLAPASHPLAAVLRVRLPEAAIDAVADPALLAPRRYDTAVVAGVLETLAAPAARVLLAALRDRVAAHTLLWVDAAAGVPLAEEDLRALGFRLLARDGTHALSGIDLRDYKDRPDWLNPSNWAHPERWDQFRW